jgi:hypothetical protein
MRKWLARLAFSFLVISIFFALEGYQIHRGDRGPGHEWKMYAFFAGAAVFFVLGLRGMRERHRPWDRPADSDGGERLDK